MLPVDNVRSCMQCCICVCSNDDVGLTMRKVMLLAPCYQVLGRRPLVDGNTQHYMCIASEPDSIVKTVVIFRRSACRVVPAAAITGVVHMQQELVHPAVSMSKRCVVP